MFHRIAGAALAAVLTLLPAAPSWAADPCADWTPQPRPQNASRDIVGQDIDTIQERGYMTFAVYADNPPYSWEERGTPRGVDVDIARLIAEDVGVEPRFRFVEADENLEADLRNNVWRGPIVGGAVSNVMMRVPYDSQFKCRVDQVVFTGQYAGETLALAYSEAAYPDGPPVPAYFRFETVAVENDSLADFYLSGLFGGQMRANIRRYPTMAEAMAALAAGETSAAMGPMAQLEHGKAAGIAIHRPPLPGLSRGNWTLGVAVHQAYRPLAYRVDDAVRYALEDGRIRAIYAAHGLEHLAPER